MTMVHRTKWFLPGFALALGLCFLAAFWAGGNFRDGIFSLGVMTAFGLVLLFGGRSEMIRGLRGDGRDEWWERLDLRASALAGLVTISAIIVMFLWEWAHGRDGSPYVQLGTIAGVAYIVGIAFLRWRG
jgi:hypothetical protein